MGLNREKVLLGIIVFMGMGIMWLGLQVSFLPQENGQLSQLHFEHLNRFSHASSEKLMGEAPFQGGRVRGFVEKQGALPPVYYTGSTAGLRYKAFMTWLDAYKNGNPVTHAALPYPYCGVFINHHYKFIWIKGYKVAGTSMQGPLRYLCDYHGLDPPGADYSLCAEAGFTYITNVTDAELQKWWKEYFVFSVTRNPYSRFASAEEYILETLPEECGRPTFNETCHDPYIDTRLCQEHCCEERFVMHNYRHFTEQSTCLFTETLLPAVDFIGEYENLEADFDTIISEINRRRNASLPPLTSKLGRLNARSRRLQEGRTYAYEFFKQNPQCLDRIRQFYNRDFTLLKYNEVKRLD